MDASILVVDDTPENLRLLVRTLSVAGYRVRAAPSGELALRMARSEPPDLVMLDVDMPGMNGFEVCEAMSAEPSLQRVPVIFISALSDATSKIRGFRAGGRDFVTKPFSVEEVLARVSTHLELRRLEAQLASHNAELERRVAEQVREISDAQVATIVALARLSESRDDTTGMHVERIAALSAVLAHAAARRPGRNPALGAAAITTMSRAAALHDIGKVGIPDAVLLKPAKLTDEEYAVMKTHAAIGHATLDAVLKTYPGNELVRVGSEIARSHHERWDGAGYPDGLAADAIPLTARLVAVVDVYDAIRSARPYKAALPRDATAAIILRGRGAHFDPDLVDAFEDAEPEIDALWAAMHG
jgi:putative two-component system response regulator